MSGLLRGFGRFVIGIVIGAAAGAAAGTLYAPARGEELKRQLRERLEAARTAGARAEQETVAELQRQYHLYVDKRDE